MPHWVQHTALKWYLIAVTVLLFSHQATAAQIEALDDPEDPQVISHSYYINDYFYRIFANDPSGKMIMLMMRPCCRPCGSGAVPGGPVIDTPG